MSRFILAIAASLFLGACASPKLIDADVVTFYLQPSAAVSSIWDNGTDTFIAPKRKKGIDAVNGLNGAVLPVSVSGAYFKVEGVHNTLILKVNGESFTAKKQ